MSLSQRLQALSSAFPRLRVDAYLITHLPNVRYLCGFTGSAGVLLLAGSDAIFFTDGRYTQQAREEIRGARVVIGKKSPLAAAAEWLGRKPKGLWLGIESDHMTVASEARLRSLLPKAWRLRPVSGALPGSVERQRMVKDPAEVELLRRAVKLGSSLFAPLLKTIRPGVAETVVAAKLEYSARQAGAAGMSFDSIVAAGPRSAMPHGRASSTPIPRQGLVVLDFGVILAGYCSDMTRTVALGRASANEAGWYHAVLESQLAGIAAVRPGVTAGQVDEACRKVLKKNKLAQYFTHSTGHGVGLEIHEPPRLAAGETAVLEPGMVLTIEPGVYIPGQGGVRIEDMILVTKTGCEVLTPTTKDFVTIS